MIYDRQNCIATSVEVLCILDFELKKSYATFKPMDTLKDLKVNIAHRSKLNLQYQSELKIKDLSTREKLKAGLKFLSASFALAIFFVFIPVLHFFLVPSALLIGGVLFYRQLNYHYLRMESQIQCPDCKSEVNLKKSSFNWPMRVSCGQCLAQLNIDPV